MRSRLNIALIIIITIVIGSLSIGPAIKHFSAYLSISEPVNANVLIVEGWLPRHYISKAYQEYIQKKYDYIITSGIRKRSEYYELSVDGYLIFYPDKKQSGREIMELTLLKSLPSVNREAETVRTLMYMSTIL